MEMLHSQLLLSYEIQFWVVSTKFGNKVCFTFPD